MSILSVNKNLYRDYPTMEFEDGEFSSVEMGMEEKVFSREVWGWR
jgi:hypothetical protein